MERGQSVVLEEEFTSGLVRTWHLIVERFPDNVDEDDNFRESALDPESLPRPRTIISPSNLSLVLLSHPFV